jgi:hypothetical protein
LQLIRQLEKKIKNAFTLFWREYHDFYCPFERPDEETIRANVQHSKDVLAGAEMLQADVAACLHHWW